jgi:hypothetical protein
VPEVFINYFWIRIFIDIITAAYDKGTLAVKQIWISWRWPLTKERRIDMSNSGPEADVTSIIPEGGDDEHTEELPSAAVLIVRNLRFRTDIVPDESFHFPQY